MSETTNVVVVGLGGQGVLKASDILADAAFAAGYDVKKSDIRGMSQRGGSVASDVRFGEKVLSPMTPSGEADFLVVLTQDQVDINRGALRKRGVLIEPSIIAPNALPHPKGLNIALLGALSCSLDISDEHWLAAIRANLPEEAHELNVRAFELGKRAAGMQ